MHLRTVLRNIFSNWAGYAVALVIGFLLSPYLVHHLGKTMYGVWTLVVSVTGYFGILDLGLRQSVGRFIARHVALEDPDGVNRTLNTALAMLASAGLLALTATIAATLGFGIFHIDPSLEGMARTALLIAGLNISLALPCSVFSTVLVALERFDLTNAIAVAGAISRAVLSVIALQSGQGLVAIALIMLFVSVGEYTATALCATRLYRPLQLRWAFVDRATSRQIFSFGIYRFVWIIANQLIFYTDTVVIGIFLNAAAITSYAIAGSLIAYGRNVVSLASDAFYPVAARLDSKNDMEGMRRVLIFGTNVALLIGLPICFGYLFLGRQFITLWMGNEFSSSAIYLAVLTIPQFASLPQYISAQVLVGLGKHQVLARVAIVEGVLNLILSIILIRKIGLVGVAWGTVIPHLVNAAVIIPAYTLRTVGLSAREYFLKGYLRPLICAGPPAILCYGFSVAVANPSWLVFGGEVATVAALMSALAYLICLTPEQKTAVKSRVTGLLDRAQALEKA